MRIYLERHTVKFLFWALVFFLALAIGSWLSGIWGACTPLPTCTSSRAAGPPTLTNSATVDGGTTATVSLSVPGDPAMVGDIFVSIRAGTHTGHSFTVTDSSGNAYAKTRQLEGTLDSSSLALFHAENANLGASTITVNDSTAPGTLRVIAQKYTGVGSLKQAATGVEGSGTSVTLPPSPPPGIFRFVAVTSSNGTTGTAQPAGTPGDSVAGKLFAYGSPSSLTLNPADDWGLLTADFDAGTECATPTPVLLHDPVADADLAGYTTYYQMPGGTPQKLVDHPCWIDVDGSMVCRGVTMGDIPQRDCPSCVPFELYEFSRKAWDHDGNYSLDYSNWVTICMPPICTPPGPCN